MGCLLVCFDAVQSRIKIKKDLDQYNLQGLTLQQWQQDRMNQLKVQQVQVLQVPTLQWHQQAWRWLPVGVYRHA